MIGNIVSAILIILYAIGSGISPTPTQEPTESLPEFENLREVMEYCGANYVDIIELVTTNQMGNYFVSDKLLLEDTQIIKTIGEGDVGGYDVPEDTILQLIGYIPENNTTVSELVSFGVLDSPSEHRMFILVYVDNVLFPATEYEPCVMVEIEISDAESESDA